MISQLLQLPQSCTGQSSWSHRKQCRNSERKNKTKHLAGWVPLFLSECQKSAPSAGFEEGYRAQLPGGREKPSLGEQAIATLSTAHHLLWQKGTEAHSPNSRKCKGEIRDTHQIPCHVLTPKMRWCPSVVIAEKTRGTHVTAQKFQWFRPKKKGVVFGFRARCPGVRRWQP